MIKTVVQAHYAHKSNISELLRKKVPIEERIDVLELLRQVEGKYDYTVVKYDRGNITLIYSSDWDSANEPIVDVCYRWKSGEWFDANGKITTPKVLKNGRQIYHNKWQFVGENYDGFDIEEAKARTKLWNAIPNLNKSKIGNKTYWVELLTKHGIPV